jgi:hypothetical protein
MNFGWNNKIKSNIVKILKNIFKATNNLYASNLLEFQRHPRNLKNTLKFQSSII